MSSCIVIRIREKLYGFRSQLSEKFCSHDRLHHDGLGLPLQSEEMNELFDAD